MGTKSIISIRTALTGNDSRAEERFMKEIRRRTKVVGAFPDGQSCLNLAAARLRHIASSKWSKRKYMNMTPLFAEQISTSGAVA
jgi:putative transposase